MPSKVFSAALIGLEAQPIEVEVDMFPGQLPSFNIVGLPDTAVSESKERVSSAIRNTGGSPPLHSNRKVIVNLAPADIKKEGSVYDLPIAVGYLIASNQLTLKNTAVSKTLFIGELSLEGKLRPAYGILPVALMAKTLGFNALFVPKENAAEAALVKNIEVFPVESLEQIIQHLEETNKIIPAPPTEISQYFSRAEFSCDMGFIKGQEHAKRALEIAAAGAHNILFSGPPGAGKTLLARTIPSILPPMTFDEALEVTKIYSIVGYLSKNNPVVGQRPFRSPHHTASAVALVGGGAVPKPGEITLSHRGFLFLDEFPEFNRQVLEALRQPLEDGIISVARAQRAINFPARFMLVAAMNPCPCGKLTDPARDCQCSPAQVLKYKRKISGPLLDRIDLHIEVPPVKFDKLSSEKVAEESASVRQRVSRARKKQEERFAALPISSNSEMGIKEIKQFCALDAKTKDFLKNAAIQLNLSARSFYRVLKLSRTIADLAASSHISFTHVAEALQYRPKEEI